MSCTCAPALVALRNEVNDRFLRRDKSSDGCCGDAAHAARTSDHNPDAAGYAHALDIDEDIEPGRDLLWLVPILQADSRTKYTIYERVITYRDCKTHGTGQCPGHPYTGVNAHLHHLHLSIKSTATFDKRRWLTVSIPATENDMTAEEHQLLVDLHAWMSTEGKPMALRVAALQQEVAALKAKLGEGPGAGAVADELARRLAG